MKLFLPFQFCVPRNLARKLQQWSIREAELFLEHSPTGAILQEDGDKTTGNKIDLNCTNAQPQPLQKPASAKRNPDEDRAAVWKYWAHETFEHRSQEPSQFLIFGSRYLYQRPSLIPMTVQRDGHIAFPIRAWGVAAGRSQERSAIRCGAALTLQAHGCCPWLVSGNPGLCEAPHASGQRLLTDNVVCVRAACTMWFMVNICLLSGRLEFQWSC